MKSVIILLESTVFGVAIAVKRVEKSPEFVNGGLTVTIVGTATGTNGSRTSRDRGVARK
jgi:hypothetical protein